MLEAIRQLLPEYYTFIAGEVDPVLVIQKEPPESWLYSIVTRLTPDDSLFISYPDPRHKCHYEDEVALVRGKWELLLADPQFASKLRQICSDVFKSSGPATSPGYLQASRRDATMKLWSP